MKINPTAIVFWLFCGMMGFLIGGSVHAGMVGFTASLGVSILIDILPEKKKRW